MNKEIKKAAIYNYLKLGKFSVIIPVSLTAFTGYFLLKPGLDLNILLVTFGVFLQGMAASALNQVQESRIDARMLRTMYRPIPAGRIGRNQAVLFAIITLFLGSIALYAGGTLLAVLFGLFTLAWYNGVYTPLKRYSAFAVIPGSLTGAIPPIIGWTAAGGDPFHHTVILLAFLFFMGQVPHFWLLILKYGEEYRKAGLPSLTDIFSTRQINNLSFTWISASLISALMLGWFGILDHLVARIILVLITIVAIFIFRELINKEDSTGRKKYFIELNIYYFLLIVLLLVDKIVH